MATSTIPTPAQRLRALQCEIADAANRGFSTTDIAGVEAFDAAVRTSSRVTPRRVVPETKPVKFKEVIIFIHGVTENPDVDSPRKWYDDLYDGVDLVIGDRRKAWRDATRCDVFWGFNYDDIEEPTGHRLLTQAEKELGDRVMQKVHDTWEFTLNPMRLAVTYLARPLSIYRFADIFYYVSSDGKAAIRAAVAEQVMQQIDPQDCEEGEGLSLTILGHSAGSVIAFDFCFFLFFSEDHAFVDPSSMRKMNSHTHHACNQMKELRTLAQTGRLRLRRLYTFGSPISMVAYRADSLLSLFAKGKRLNPRHYGLLPTKPQEPLEGPRWINIWDKDDPIAYPVEPLLHECWSGRLIKDINMDVSMSVAAAHNAYWDSPEVYQAIADHW